MQFAIPLPGTKLQSLKILSWQVMNSYCKRKRFKEVQKQSCTELVFHYFLPNQILLSYNYFNQKQVPFSLKYIQICNPKECCFYPFSTSISLPLSPCLSLHPSPSAKLVGTKKQFAYFRILSESKAWPTTVNNSQPF